MVQWRGDKVKARAEQAAVRAVDRVMGECVIHARRNHPGWRNQTGAAEGSVAVVQFAKKVDDAVTGLWGSQGVHYVLWLELKHGGFLRNAADAIYPKLPQYIREAFSG